MAALGHRYRIVRHVIRWDAQVTTQELLIKARDIFAKHGGAKGTLQDKAGKVCLQGAINWAQTGHPRDWDWGSQMNDAYLIINDIILEFDERYYGTAGSFNDSHTIDDVLAVFDKAIARTEA